MHRATTFTLTSDLITTKPIESIWASKENNRVMLMAKGQWQCQMGMGMKMKMGM